MDRARWKGIVLVAALVALAGIAIWQQTLIVRLTAENTRVKQQAQQEAFSPGIAERRATPQPSYEVRPSLTQPVQAEPSREILRLRGQVGVLRAQLAEAELHPSEAAISRGYQESRLRAAGTYIDSLQKKLGELAFTLAVPEAVARMDPQEALRDTNLVSFRPYFQAKSDLGEWLKLRDTLGESVARAK